MGEENRNCDPKTFVEKRQINIAKKFNKNHNSQGLMIALSILSLWSINTFVSLSSNLNMFSPWQLLIVILLQTFLNTGLFITAHDGMHGLIKPSNTSVNNFIGSLAVNLYGLFSYQQLKYKHLLHHLYPATDLDPDYHHDSHSNFVSWYGEFMMKYMSSQQLLKLLVFVLLMIYSMNVSWLNLILCWALPLILSSLQLFTFGTFFPHRQIDKAFSSISPIKSLNFSPFWSLIACYNFSYHWEHHQYPHLAWWQLSRMQVSAGE